MFEEYLAIFDNEILNHRTRFNLEKIKHLILPIKRADKNIFEENIIKNFVNSFLILHNIKSLLSGVYHINGKDLKETIFSFGILEKKKYNKLEIGFFIEKLLLVDHKLFDLFPFLLNNDLLNDSDFEKIKKFEKFFFIEKIGIRGFDEYLEEEIDENDYTLYKGLINIINFIKSNNEEKILEESAKIIKILNSFSDSFDFFKNRIDETNKIIESLKEKIIENLKNNSNFIINGRIAKSWGFADKSGNNNKWRKYYCLDSDVFYKIIHLSRICELQNLPPFLNKKKIKIINYLLIQDILLEARNKGVNYEEENIISQNIGFKKEINHEDKYEEIDYSIFFEFLFKKEAEGPEKKIYFSYDDDEELSINYFLKKIEEMVDNYKKWRNDFFIIIKDLIFCLENNITSISKHDWKNKPELEELEELEEYYSKLEAEYVVLSGDGYEYDDKKYRIVEINQLNEILKRLKSIDYNRYDILFFERKFCNVGISYEKLEAAEETFKEIFYDLNDQKIPLFLSGELFNKFSFSLLFLLFSRGDLKSFARYYSSLAKDEYGRKHSEEYYIFQKPIAILSKIVELRENDHTELELWSIENKKEESWRNIDTADKEKYHSDERYHKNEKDFYNLLVFDFWNICPYYNDRFEYVKKENENKQLIKKKKRWRYWWYY